MELTRRITSLLFLSGIAATQAICQPPTNDFLRSTGKIYVVVAVLVVIFLVLMLYLITLDRRIQKLENQMLNGKNQ